jgi:hypothetical protein
MSNKDTIIINGRRYDIVTGNPVPEQPMVGAKLKPEVIKKSTHKRSSSALNHAKPHAQAHSKLLMRRAVINPRRNTREEVIAKTQTQTRTFQLPAHHYHKRLVHANAVSRSQSFKHFSTSHSLNHYSTSPSLHKSLLNHDKTHAASKHLPSQVLSKRRTVTSKELLDRALREATAHEHPLMPKPHRNRAKAHHFFSRLRTV